MSSNFKILKIQLQFQILHTCTSFPTKYEVSGEAEGKTQRTLKNGFWEACLFCLFWQFIGIFYMTIDVVDFISSSCLEEWTKSVD